MNTASKFKARGVMLKIAFLLMLFLCIASGSQTPGDDGNLTDNRQWNLHENDGGSYVQESAGGENNAADVNTISTAMFIFDFQNQSDQAGAEKVIIGNDSAKIIKLEAKDINNDLLDYALVRSPSHGKISGTAPNIVYVPEKGYVGDDSIVFSAVDQIGNLQNITVSIDVVKLYHPPSVRILSPIDGDLFTAFEETFTAQIPLRVAASGGPDFISVSDITEGTEYGPESCSAADGDNCRVTMFGDFFIGKHTLIARSYYSTSGRIINSSPVTIVVNPSEPIAKIATPLDGEIFTAPAEITITAKADVTSSDNSISNVEYFENSHWLGIPDYNVSPYPFTWKGVTPGVYNIVAKATDVFGQSAISPSVMIVVVPPKPLSKSDLALTMKSSPNPAPAGGLLNYVLTLTNMGPDSATDVVVEDYLPPELTFMNFKASQGVYEDGIWNVGSLTKYRSAKLVLTVLASSEDIAGQLANTAYVYGAELDPDNSNNHFTAYTRIRSTSNSSPE